MKNFFKIFKKDELIAMAIVTIIGQALLIARLTYIILNP